jgi:predicted secreted protein
MTEQEEEAYMQGSASAYLAVFNQCIRHLPDLKDEARRLSERAAVISVLRRICTEHGDNDWDDGLHMVDIITKHLEPYLSNE